METALILDIYAEIIIIGIACIPPIIIIIVMILNGKKFFIKGLKYLLFSSLLLLSVLSYQYIMHKGKELKYVGTYFLKHYPYCNSCVLKLKENNEYLVIKSNNTIEKGTWEYVEDKNQIKIGSKGNLGRGKYKYDKKRSPLNTYRRNYEPDKK